VAKRNFVTGKVYLVGAGPGDPELLTLKALKLLKTADVVLHDDLIGPEILAFIPSTTKIQNVGKRCGWKSIRQEEINSLLLQFASLGLQVVRLKSGDPLIFGRAGEEIEALRRAKIDFEIVPGVTASLGAAAAANIPLTHRRISSALIFLTSHHSNGNDLGEWPAHLSPGATLVIYMPGYQYQSTVRRLIEAGLEATTPCAIISQATSPDQQVHHTTLQDLPIAPRLPAPTLLIVGEVVRFADKVSLREEFAWSGLEQATHVIPLVAQSSFSGESEEVLGTQEQSE
jgi:uroporphyrin-III C-methyltransferase